MENTHNDDQKLPSREGYVPRPAWQVWMARVGLVLFVLFVAYQIWMLFTGGLV